MTNSLVLTKGPLKPNGLYDLYLDAWQGTKYIGRMLVESGAPGRQNFRTVPTERREQLEPCPEGEFDLGPLEWAAGSENYTRNWENIDSPLWVTIYRGRAIGFHLDGNRRYAPGSAGCVVFKTMADLQLFVSWWKAAGGFQKMYVDYGLGYVRVPAAIRTAPKPAAAAPAAKPGPTITVFVKNKHRQLQIPVNTDGKSVFSFEDLIALGLVSSWDYKVENRTLTIET